MISSRAKVLWLFPFVLALSMISSQVFASISLTLPPNYDFTRSTQYRFGEKPIDTPECPTGWTCANKGDGAGTIDEVSTSEFDFNTSGTSVANAFRYVYKDPGANDFQIIARVTNEYAGSLANFAGIGVGISDGTGDSDEFHNCWSPSSSTTVVRSRAGNPTTSTSVNGADGQSRPRYLAETYDLSATESKCHESTDGVTWVEVATYDYAYTTPIVYLFAQSGSTSAMQGTADNIAFGTTITVYTPVDPPGGSAPTLVTPISNQSGTQAVAFSLDVSTNFTGETSYTATGIPGAGGLSFSTVTGILSGTPDADDVSASPFNVIFCGVNVDGSTCDTAQITISAPPSSGDTFTIPTSASARTFNCASTTGANGANWSTLGGTGTPQGGDVIVLAAGTHREIQFRNCDGASLSSPITIRNNTAGGGPAVISTVGTPGFGLENSTFITVDGTGKWSGAPAGICGYTATTQTEGTTQCGIVIESADTSNPTHYFRLDGQVTRGITVKGVEIDGTGATGGGSGIGFSLNDHNFQFDDCVGGVSNPECWREDITFENVYVHHVGSANAGEGLYLGPNAYGKDGTADPDLPLRRITVRNALVENTRRNGIELKSMIAGPNFVEDNLVRASGLSGEQGQGSGITVLDGGDVTIGRNRVIDANGPGIACTIQNSIAAFTPVDGPYYCTIENNIVVSAGSNGVTLTRKNTTGTPGGVGQQIPGVRQQLSPIVMQNNTVIDSSNDCAQFSNFTGSLTARDNLCAGATANSRDISGITDTNTQFGTVASQFFVNAGAGNYELTVNSPACNNSTSNAPATDYEGESRPLDSADDQGADEAAACL